MPPIDRLRQLFLHTERRNCCASFGTFASCAATAHCTDGGKISDNDFTIISVKCYVLKLPGIRCICVVCLKTANGLYGVGESGLSFRELAVQGAVRHFEQFLVGKDARRIGALWQEMYRSQYFEGVSTRNLFLCGGMRGHAACGRGTGLEYRAADRFSVVHC